MRVFLKLYLVRDALLDSPAQRVERPGSGISGPTEDELTHAARPDQLIVDQVGRETAHGQPATPLANDLMCGGKADEMCEALYDNARAVTHKAANRLLHRHQFC